MEHFILTTLNYHICPKEGFILKLFWPHEQFGPPKCLFSISVRLTEEATREGEEERAGRCCVVGRWGGQSSQIRGEGSTGGTLAV